MRTYDIEIAILDKMYHNHLIGEKHTSADNVGKNFPKHMRGDAKKALKNLIRQGYVVPKITSYGLEVSLNPKRINEIRKIINDETWNIGTWSLYDAGTFAVLVYPFVAY